MIAAIEEAKDLNDIPVKRVHQVQQRALLRMLLYAVGRTHEMLWDTSQKMKSALVAAADEKGKLDGLGLSQAKKALEREWASFFKEWKPMFEDLRRQAASLPFGTLAVYHDRLVRPAIEKAAATESVIDFVFNPMIQAVLDAANKRLYSDGIPLSRRIWNLDWESQKGIADTVSVGVANGMDAWTIAEELQQYLGPMQDCPRWTRTRLNKLTKKDIAAGVKTGLYSKDDCAGQGVAYKALRLARNEIQTVHHAATDQVMGMLPFIEKEQINLSPSHPVDDVCDQTVAAGEGGKGIYPKGQIELPLHVQCLCFKTAVLMDESQFVDQLRGWLNGSSTWSEMDAFQTAIGGNVNIDLTSSQVAQHLPQWAFEDPYQFN
jgi:hypothetical protein